MELGAGRAVVLSAVRFGRGFDSRRLHHTFHFQKLAEERSRRARRVALGLRKIHRRLGQCFISDSSHAPR